MKALVVGSGGRQHALVWKLKQSPQIDQLYCAPGNAGTAQIAHNVDTGVDYIDSLLNFVIDENVDITVVGPEMPLSQGISDLFRRQGKIIFGPKKFAAQLESSKEFAKQFMNRHSIPTATHQTFTDVAAAKEYLGRVPFKVVIKADGLAAGKGVIIPESKDEAIRAIDQIMVNREFGPAGDRVVIEENLVGDEATLLCFCDGKTISPMISSQDHKRVFDHDEGPNTGGIGVYAPTPLLTPGLMAKVRSRILDRIIAGMMADNMEYKGILYVGLMIVQGEPFVLEFNVRFGDPETQVVLPLLETDLVDVIMAVHEKRLDQLELKWKPQHACTVIMCSGGYPGEFETGYPITGLDQVTDAIVFHAGTTMENNSIVTSGGRVLGVTALGDTLQSAIDTAYREVRKIDFKNKHFRNDIGAKAARYI